MATLLADNAYGSLAVGLAAGDTSLTFTSGHGARFPTVASPDVLYCCILNSANILEEVIITAHALSADTATISRAAGGTTAKVWNAGDRIEARISKTALQSIAVAAVSGGSAGAIVSQVGTGTTSFSASGTLGNILLSGGTGVPTWMPSGTAGSVLVSGGTGVPTWGSALLSSLSNSLAADVNITSTASFFDGPSIAQGASGTWFASGTITVESGSTSTISSKLWDGTAVVASTIFTVTGNIPYTFSLSGSISNPAGNIRMSVKNSSASGAMFANLSGMGKDSTITAVKIG